MSTAPPSASRPVDAAVSILRDGFDQHQLEFRSLTRRARRHFERRDWQAIRRDTTDRLGLHEKAVAATLWAMAETLGERMQQPQLWATLKDAYGAAIAGRDDEELARTFFNSVGRRALARSGIDPALDFLATEVPLSRGGGELSGAHTYRSPQLDAGLVRTVLADLGFAAPWRDLEADARLAAPRLARGVAEGLGEAPLDAVDVLTAPFIRNKGAYVIGRARRGAAASPVLFALVHGEQGIELDAVLTSEDDASIVFSFARWYFLADVASPRRTVAFLASTLPRKRLAELYISLGYHKHGKTELWRDLAAQIHVGGERFVKTPGEEGLVMVVFTLPSWEFVLKVIRDAFPAAKRVSPHEVMAKYDLVLRHDRVGRLVDFQEFEQLGVPRERFDPQLLAELQRTAGRRIRTHDDEVTLAHLYVGRRVTPLDVLLASDAPAQAKRAAVLDWGHAIKDLAAVNLFAGDLLLKNFGLTRHGRVVFYDYDELAPLTDCRFREMPVARHDFEELAAEPWFAVREGDVFPEELPRFLELTGELREVFMEAHGGLFDTAFWRQMQRRNERGEIIDFFPYRDDHRLRPGRPGPV
ncbi:MAG TPA: bifunctional isocitrate dehydrogenase kinase/phosphatase [Thermoanaerobaculia bacterium]|nr:bifunctional isocitrate dehydrogenase kinase/phosphatase [Thermoanaerobaculia bacterium]